MSGYLLDTNAWIALLKNQPGVVEGVRRVGVEALYLCSPVWSELWFGACNSQRVAENQQHIRELAAYIPSLPFDDLAAEHCGAARLSGATRPTDWPLRPANCRHRALGKLMSGDSQRLGVLARARAGGRELAGFAMKPKVLNRTGKVQGIAAKNGVGER